MLYFCNTTVWVDYSNPDHKKYIITFSNSCHTSQENTANLRKYVLFVVQSCGYSNCAKFNREHDYVAYCLIGQL